MLYQVRFRQRQRNCCPPGEYWVVRTETVEADTADSAEQQVKRGWRFNHEIEIKSVKEIKDDQEKGQ